MTPAPPANPAPEPQVHTLSGATWSARLLAPHHDTIGAQVEVLEVDRTTPTSESLPERAQRVAHNLRGLSESLAVHEVDGERGEALLRSETPQARPDGVRYFEVVLTETGPARLSRYHAAPEQKRERVPFPLTHETIESVAEVLGR